MYYSNYSVKKANIIHLIIFERIDSHLACPLIRLWMDAGAV